jgi:formyltetrahydrofolate deformylase
MAIFVSKIPHCLDDILARYQSGEWKVDIPLVISNHETQKDTVHKFGPNFYCFSKNKENKVEQEKQELKLLKDYSVNFIVLARYMQILSNDFVSHYRNKIINIHHSFLPAFPGAKPYHSAYERGVKIIGATSHYVTEDLDEGPIIYQDVARVTHRDSVSDMIRIGRDLEKIVLARAIHAHLSRKVMVYKNKTIVFS